MPRKPRIDYPGAWHHVCNRGLAKRTVFETREDMRYFLSCVARAVRAGLIEVHAFCLLPNHFHLLVRSLRGELSRAMFLIENRYVRWFNRRRRRDGPLFRGRYFAGLIESDAYWYAVIHYIDANPVEAGLADSAAQYPWCSTSYFLPRRASKWLVDDEVGTCVREIHESHLPRPNFGILEEMIESRLTARHDGPDPLDDLVRGAPRAAFEKMRRRAELADGSIVGIRLAHPETLLRFLRRRRRRRPLLVVEGARKGLDAWPILEVGILMEAAGLSGREAAALTDTPQSTVYRRSRLHEQALSKNVRYAAEAFWIVTKAVREDLGAQILESGGRHRRPRFKAD